MVTRLPGLARLQEIGAAFYASECSRVEARAAVIDVISGQPIRDLRAIVAKLALLTAAAGDALLWATPSRPMAPIVRRPS